jgi:hypothetical protein
MIIGRNWFIRYSHISVSHDNFILALQIRKRVAAS